jgi:ferredoxin-NADP reductase
VTSLKSMAHQFAGRDGVDYEFHYCARDARSAAFTEEPASLIEPDRLHFHFDGGDPPEFVDYFTRVSVSETPNILVLSESCSLS